MANGYVHFPNQGCPVAGRVHKVDNSQSPRAIEQCMFRIENGIPMFKCLSGGCEGKTFKDVNSALIKRHPKLRPFQVWEKPQRDLFLRHSTMAAVKVKQLVWAVRHVLLMAALNMFTGNPDAGKTLAAIYYMALLSRQGKTIVVICREDDYGSVWKPRLWA